MILYTAPERFPLNLNPKLFLGGSIEQGTAINWQEKIIERLSHLNCTILNPRRKEWDASWIQSIKNKHFKEQVVWELQAMEVSNIILIYLDPNTKAPISLYELGLNSKDGSKIVYVYCPEGFYRKGNIDIYCEKYKLNLFEDEELLIQALIMEVIAKDNIK